MKQLYGEKGRDREGEGKKKSIGERLSICTSRESVCAHARGCTSTQTS